MISPITSYHELQQLISKVLNLLKSIMRLYKEQSRTLSCSMRLIFYIVYIKESTGIVLRRPVKEGNILDKR